METSEQQRRPTVGQLAQALTTAKLDFDAIDLADMVWLAQFMEPGEPQRVVPPPDSSSSDSPLPSPPPPPLPADDESGIEEPELEVYPEDAAPSAGTPEAEQEDVTPEVTPTGTPLAIPAAPALRTSLNLARSLRPLMRKVPSRTRFELDETATVTQIAETEVWLPVVRPTPERWLELELVVESSKTTVIWERSITELNHIAEYQGAFRAVRTWRLAAQGETVQLFPRWREGSVKQTESQLYSTSARPHTPQELLDPTGRRLIWFVTDCTSDLWRQGVVYPALQQWAAVQPLIIVQMLPPPLWKRTALRDGHQVRLSALAPGLPNARLVVDGLPRRLERRSRAGLVTVPVVTLDAAAMQQWTHVLAGMGDSRTPGRTFDLRFIERQAATVQTGNDERLPDVPTAQERVDLFRATTASDTVKQLANLMAATPVTLPVIDLLRETFRADFKEEVRQSHVAEVLLSGLLRRCDTDEDEVCRYEFWGDDAEDPMERVRDILLGDTSIAKTRQVLDVLSASICQKINSPVKTFQALLAELNTEEASDELRSAAMPFARIGLDVLYRLGGEHAAIARQYDPQRKQRSGGSDVSDDWLSGFTYEKLTYQVAEYIDFPAIEPFDFEEGELIEEASDTFPPALKPDNFTVIILEATKETPSDNGTETLAEDMPMALEQNEFFLLYQPIFALSSRQLIGFEALLRWRHPQRGLIYPQEFVPIAKASNQLANLDYLALEVACQQLATWQKQFPESGNLEMGINISPEMFRKSGWLDQVEQTLNLTSVKPTQIVLEITESVLLNIFGQDISPLTKLRDLGIKISLDDFGTGYSSLSYLSRAPLTQLKIDRSFVHSLGTEQENSIVSTIIMLGRQLSMTVVAESIETSEQLSRLREFQCEFGQGYFLAQPDTAEMVERLLGQPSNLDLPSKQDSNEESSKSITEAFDFTIATLTKIPDTHEWVIERRPGSAQHFIEQLPNKIALEMVSIPGGTFLMGSPEDEPERSANRESPQHEVMVQSFFIGRYPVTQAQWRAVASLPQVERDLDADPACFKGDEHPVERVSWDDAVEFCARLSAYTERPYHLPSEAQWEYACRAGTTTPFHFGNMLTTEVANYNGSYTYADGPTGEDRESTTPMRHFRIANAFGLSDMHGNVREWCEDYWHGNYEDAPNDGSAWIEGGDSSYRVRRGGSWNYYPRFCRSADRYFYRPGYRVNDIGFRVCCSPPRA